MAKLARDSDGLSPKEARACVLRAQGYSQAAAWKEAFNKPRATMDQACKAGSTLFAKPYVKGRLRALLDASKVQDIISMGRWGQMVLDGPARPRG